MYTCTCKYFFNFLTAVERYHVSVRIGEQSRFGPLPKCYIILHHARGQQRWESAKLALWRGKWQVGQADEYVIGTPKHMHEITSVTIGFTGLEEGEKVFLEEVRCCDNSALVKYNVLVSGYTRMRTCMCLCTCTCTT